SPRTSVSSDWCTSSSTRRRTTVFIDSVEEEIDRPCAFSVETEGEIIANYEYYSTSTIA
ncbi:hypothetical protein NPIL_399981, partial [Nephila pilipes]